MGLDTAGANARAELAYLLKHFGMGGVQCMCAQSHQWFSIANFNRVQAFLQRLQHFGHRHMKSRLARNPTVHSELLAQLIHMLLVVCRWLRWMLMQVQVIIYLLVHSSCRALRHNS